MIVTACPLSLGLTQALLEGWEYRENIGYWTPPVQNTGMNYFFKWKIVIPNPCPPHYKFMVLKLGFHKNEHTMFVCTCACALSETKDYLY